MELAWASLILYIVANGKKESVLIRSYEVKHVGGAQRVATHAYTERRPANDSESTKVDAHNNRCDASREADELRNRRTAGLHYRCHAQIYDRHYQRTLLEFIHNTSLTAYFIVCTKHYALFKASLRCNKRIKKERKKRK